MIEQFLDDPDNFLPIAEMCREKVDVKNDIEQRDIGRQGAGHSVPCCVLTIVIIVKSYFHVELARNHFI